MLYDIPVRTGRKIDEATMLRLAREVPTIVAVKDAAGNPGASAQLLAQAPDGFELYSGDDAMTLPLLAIGASGVVSAAAHWTGEQQAGMVAALTKGAGTGGGGIKARLTESWAFETSDATPNPLPTKAMMRVMGLPSGQCRLPLGPAPEGLEDRARAVLANLGGTAVA